MDPEDAEAICVACPADEESFLKYLRETRDLRLLPKAHLHVHAPGTLRRNVDLKKTVDAFNAQPDAAECIRKAKEDKVKKSEECAARGDMARRDDIWQHVHRKHAEELLSGDTLRVAGPFWDEETRLLKCAYDFQELDKVSPWGGASGFNASDNMWHGMGGTRDYSCVRGVLEQLVPNGLDLVTQLVAASEDAKAEGIRHVEYMWHNKGIEPERGEDGAIKPVSDEAWMAYRSDLLDIFCKVRDAVPEVNIAIILPASFCDLRWVRSWCEHYSKDGELKALLRGVGEAGAAIPANHAEFYKMYVEAGLEPVMVHVGEWCEERAELVEEGLSRMRGALEIGVRRMGHGILAHVDTELMAKLKDRDVCLEVCPVSNRVLDNVPKGIAAHPLRKLFDAGVPVALAADDPAHMGAHNSQGLVREFHFARSLQGFTPVELGQLARNSFKYSLAPEHIKDKAYADIDEWVKRAM